MALSYDPARILGYALEWFDKHEEQRPRCTCSTNAHVTETINSSIHKDGCPVRSFAVEGWRWAVDRYMEMQREDA